MPGRSYGQYCGFSRALEIVGERWALLIVRDLLVGPKRFSDLQRGLPGIPSNILTTRLKELEDDGIVQRRLLPRPSGAVVYELTTAGRQLEEPVISLGRWGAKRLGEPRADETVTEDSIASALLSTFCAKAAGRSSVSYELRVGSGITVHARVRGGKLEVGRGPLTRPDLIIEAGPGIRALMAREISPEEALRKKIVRVRGDKKLLTRFTEMFQI
ncbi:MAG: helix-turn-helix transcriptional regulator [Candidatus Eremiobacteraeota bacterium]|nr:helix-turn-helix transcriptional regulator [Candidatus Eremiobacteraeota bacterium]